MRFTRLDLVRLFSGLALPLMAASSSLAVEPRETGPQRPVVTPAEFLDSVLPAHKAAVTQVVRQPTLTAKAADDPFTAHAAIYDWLLDHPDRASLAWQRMKVACVDIEDLGGGKFYWADGSGSEMTWQSVGRFNDGLIWYATGKVKPGAVLPLVPVRAVAVLKYPRLRSDASPGAAMFVPSIQIYLLTDSRAANAVLKMAGPAAPRMAEQGAEQMLLFFSGPARHLYRHPDEVATLLAPKSPEGKVSATAGESRKTSPR